MCIYYPVMPEETLNSNQRPTVIAAVVLAALTAAGLWYFFVFRPADVTEEVVTETPLITNEGVAMVDEPGAVTAPVTESPTPYPTPYPMPAVQTTAATGPASITLLAALTAVTAGLPGWWLARRR